jgi:hypothetical protein
MIIKEGRVMNGGICSQESLPNRPAPPASNKTALIDTAAEWQAGYKDGVEAAAVALEAYAKRCDCSARNEDECACGAWDDYKSITSARAVEIVRALAT